MKKKGNSMVSSMSPTTKLPSGFRSDIPNDAIIKVEQLLLYAQNTPDNAQARQFAETALNHAESFIQDLSTHAALRKIYLQYNTLLESLELDARAYASISTSPSVERAPLSNNALNALIQLATQNTAFLSHSAALSTASLSEISKARKAIEKGDKYANRSQYDKARAAYKQAESALPEEARERLNGIPAKIESLADTPRLPSAFKSLFEDFWVKANPSHKFAKKSDPVALRVPANLQSPAPLQSASYLAEQDAADAPIQNIKLLARRYNTLAHTTDVQAASLQSLRELARATIETFSTQAKAHAIVKENVQEIAHLRVLADAEIYSLLISAMLEVLRSGFISPSNILVAQALAITIREYPFEIHPDNASGSDLLRNFPSMLSGLHDCVEKVHKEKNIVPLRAALAPLTETLDLLAFAGISGIDKILYRNLDTLLSTLSNSHDKVIRHQARYTQQALAHIGDTESTQSASSYHAMHAGVAVVALSNAALKQDFGSLSTAFKHAQQAVPGTLTESWYLVTHHAELRLKDGRWEDFKNFLNVNNGKLHKEFLRRICIVLEGITLSHADNLMRGNAQDILDQLLEKDANLQKFWNDYQGIQNKTQPSGMPPIFKSGSKKIAPLDLYPVWDPFWKADPDTKIIRRALYTQQQAFEQSGILQPASHIELHRKIHALNDTFARYLDHSGEIRNALSTYLPLEGYAQGKGGQLQAVHTLIETFLQQTEKKVLLLLGEAGTGKSTSALYFAREKLTHYTTQSGSKQPLVIFIPLRRVENPKGQIIESFLKNHDFTDDHIKQLRDHSRCIFIFDGYDEIEKRNFAFYEHNELWKWQNAQFIVTSRPDSLQNGYQKYFYPAGSPELLQECWIAPFSKAHQKTYIAHHARSTDWSAEEYEAKLSKFNGLEGIVDRPFTLRLLLQILPKLENTSANLTLSHIYEAYLEQWWDQTHTRLINMQLSGSQLEAMEELSKQNGGFIQEGIEYSQESALVLRKYYWAATRDMSKLDIASQHMHIYFSGDHKAVQFLYDSGQSGIFTKDADGFPKFIHRSFEDYLSSCAIASDLENELNEIDLVNSPMILEFLAEFVRRKQLPEEDLWHWVRNAKPGEDAQRMGAANAATILARAGLPFSGQNLNGVNLRGADLRYAVLDHTQLEGADLTGVNLTDAWMRGVNLNNADLTGVIFGENNALKMPAEKISQLAPYVSSNERYYIHAPVSKGSSLIECYDIEEQDIDGAPGVLHSFAKGNRNPVPIAPSANNEKILFLGEKGFLELWSLERKKPLAFFAHGSRIQYTALCEKGHFAISAGLLNKGHIKGTKAQGSLIKVWSAEAVHSSAPVEGEPIGVFENSSIITSLAISSRRMVIFGTQDKMITVCSWEAGNPYTPTSYAFNNKAVIAHSLVISEDGKRIIAGNEDGTIHIWSIHNLQEPQYILSGHTLSVRALDIYKDNNFLASGADDQTVKLWSLDTAEYLYTFIGHTHPIERVTFSTVTPSLYSTSKNRIYNPEGSRIAESGVQGYSYIMKNWRLDKLSIDPVPYPRAAIRMHFAVLSPNGEWIANLDANNNLWLYSSDLSFSQKIGKSALNSTPVIFSPDNQWITWQDDALKERVCRSLEDSCEYQFETNHTHFCTATFSEDSKQLILLEKIKNEDAIRNSQNMHQVQIFSLENLKEDEKNNPIYKYSISSSAFDHIESFSADKKHFLITHSAESITQYSITHKNAAGEILYTTPKYNPLNGSKAKRKILDIEKDIHIANVVPSPKGSWLAFTNDIYDINDTAGATKKIWLYSLKEKREEDKNIPSSLLENNASGAQYLKHCFSTAVHENLQYTFSPDEKWLAVGEQTRLVLYAIDTQQSPLIIEHGFTEEIKQIVWQGDKILLSGKYGNAHYFDVVSTPQKKCDVRLIWSIPHTAMTLEGTSIEGAQGLGEVDSALFKQFNDTEWPMGI